MALERRTLSIRPEPAPEEREAVERALAEASAPTPAGRGAWWHAGVRENAEAPPAGAAREPGRGGARRRRS